MQLPNYKGNLYLNINMNFNIPIASSVTSMPSITQHPQTAITKLQSLDMSKDNHTIDSEYKTVDKSIVYSMNKNNLHNSLEPMEVEIKQKTNKFDKAIKDNQIKEQKI